MHNRVHQKSRCLQNVVSVVLFCPFDRTMTQCEMQGTSNAILGVSISFKQTSSTNISQNIDRVPQKELLWPHKLASKHKVSCHARNTLTKYGGSPFSFGPSPPATKGLATPIVRSKMQNCHTELSICSFESY